MVYMRIQNSNYQNKTTKKRELIIWCLSNVTKKNVEKNRSFTFCKLMMFNLCGDLLVVVFVVFDRFVSFCEALRKKEYLLLFRILSRRFKSQIKFVHALWRRKRSRSRDWPYEHEIYLICCVCFASAFFVVFVCYNQPNKRVEI